MTGRTVRPDGSTVFAFLGVALLGGLNAIAVKATVEELEPFWGAGLRFVVAGVLLIAFVIVTGRAVPRGRSLVGAAVYGTIAFAGSFAFITPALREVPAGTVIVFLALVPLETFGLAIIQRQERFHLQGLLGAVIAFGGVLVVVADQLDAAVPPGSLVLVLAGTLFIAQGGITLKAIPRSDPFATNAVAMLSGAAILMGLSIVSGEHWAIPARQTTWVAMAYLVVLGSIVLFGLYLFALRRWTASAVSYVTLVMPLVAVPLAAMLMSERVSPSFIVGGALAMVGVYVGAFLKIRSYRTSATSLPECLPIDACAEPRQPAASLTR